MDSLLERAVYTHSLSHNLLQSILLTISWNCYYTNQTQWPVFRSLLSRWSHCHSKMLTTSFLKFYLNQTSQHFRIKISQFPLSWLLLSFPHLYPLCSDTLISYLLSFLYSYFLNLVCTLCLEFGPAFLTITHSI